MSTVFLFRTPPLEEGVEEGREDGVLEEGFEDDGGPSLDALEGGRGEVRSDEEWKVTFVG